MALIIAYNVIGVIVALGVGWQMHQEGMSYPATTITMVIAWFVWPMVALLAIVSSFLEETYE